MGWAVGSLCLLQFVDVLGVTVVVTALPRMLVDLHAPASSGGLVVTGYAAAFGGLLMFGARLGDRFGHRRAIVASLVVLAGASVVGATAGSVAVLAAARAAQGAAAAVSVPAALRLLTTVTAAGAARERAVAAWSATGAAAGASGFVVGGAVTELTSWRWVLLGYVPLAALLGVAVLGTVPADRRGLGRPASLDLGGAVSLTATVVSLVVGTSLVAEPGRRLLGGLCLLLTGVLGATVVAVERRADWPLLPGAALRLPPLRTGTLASLLNTATTSSVITLATVYLQDVRHHSPLGAGARLLPFSVAVVVGSAAAAVLLRRLRPARAIAVGLAVIAVATTGLAATTRTAELLPVWVAAAGAGLGVSAVAATAVGIDVPETWRAAASGILNTAAQLGTAVGTALLLLIVSGTGGISGQNGSGPVLAWSIAAGIAAAGAATYAGRSHRPDHRPPGESLPGRSWRRRLTLWGRETRA